tara:strand:- start:425 stop:919 length:495 start_codon:yes stop_codon:yes gene_type:complete
MQIIPNFIEDKEVQEDIKNTLSQRGEFPYFYNDVVGSPNDNSDFYFYHLLFHTDNNVIEPSQSFNNVLSPILGRLKFNYLIRAKVNLYTKKSEFIQTEMHIDNVIPHMVGLYSVNTNNGYTLFEDGTKVESIENQMVIFDGSIKHCSVSQTDTNVRVNININFQ